MTRALTLKNTTAVLILLAILSLFTLIYLILVPHTLAQNASLSAKKEQRTLNTCQTRERNIKNRLNSLTNLVTNQERKFASIAARVENRYTTKLVPKGKTIPNYNALVADIATKKATVDTSLSAAKADVAGFSCSAPDPKSQLTTFRKDMQAVKSALKDFRESIRNLIVAVRTLQGSPSPSPKPTP